MASNSTTLTLAISMLVLLQSVSAEHTIKALLRKDKDERYKDKPDVCNTDALAMFVAPQVTPSEDMHGICLNVTKPCCSLADMQKFTAGIKDSEATLIDLSNWMRNFYTYLQTVSSAAVQKMGDESRREPLKQSLTLIPHMRADVSLYFDSVLMSVYGFGCAACDAKHGADFKFDNGMLKQLTVQPAQCRRVLEMNFKLLTPIKHLSQIGKDVKLIAGDKAEDFKFDIEDMDAQIATDATAIDACLKQFNADGKDAQAPEANCIAMCKRYTPVHEFSIPYDFQQLAKSILEALIVATDRKPVEVEAIGYESRVAVHKADNGASDFELLLSEQGMNVMEQPIDPKYGKAAMGREDEKGKPVVHTVSNKLTDPEAHSTGAVVALAVLVLGSLGAAVGIVYFKTK